MGKLNLANYRPKDDSSTNTDQYRADPRMADSLILVVKSDHCLCGCRQAPTGRNAKFRMGHDARLRGKLIRAHCTNAPVTVIAENNRGEEVPTTRTAMEWADELNWANYLKVAAEREELRTAEKVARSERAVLAKATGPRVGDRQLVKVGRWEYTGSIVAIWDDGDELEVEYVTAKGDVKKHTITREQAATLAGGA